MKYLKKILNGNQKGFTLIEMLVAISILGIIAVAFLMAISVAYKANIIADERTMAESLARAQMEYVKAQPFISSEEAGWPYELPDSPPPEDWNWGDPSDLPANFSLVVTAYGITGYFLDEAQKIEITVSHFEKVVFTLEDLKVYR